MIWLLLACAGGTDGGAPTGGTSADGGTTAPGGRTATWGAALQGETWQADDQQLGSQLGGSMAAGDPFGTGRDLAMLAGYRTVEPETRIWLYALTAAESGPVSHSAEDVCPDCITWYGTAMATSTFADVDGDGFDDWISPWRASAGSLSILPGGPDFAWSGGDSWYVNAPSDSAGGLGSLLSSGDLDGDGTAELVVPRTGEAAVSVYTIAEISEDPYGDPAATQHFPAASFVGDQDVLGDIDGDGLQDVGLRLDGEDLLLLSGADALAEDGSWDSYLVTDQVVWLQVVGDLDGDGLAQVAWSDNLELHVLDAELVETWTVPLAEDITGLATHESSPPRPVDLDGDGQHDLVSMLTGEAAGVAMWFGPVPEGTLDTPDLTAGPPPDAGAEVFRSHAHWLVAPVCDADACIVVGTSGWDDGGIEDVGLVSVLELEW